MSELLFLGTCAADFSPKLKGECADQFDKDARRASCALLDGRFLIDCGPHCIDSLRIAKIDPAQITDVFFTHLHDDHFNPENLAKIAAAKEKPLDVWVRADADFPEIEGITLHRVERYQRYAVTDRLGLTTVDANHDQDYYPQWLQFDLDGKKLLYATDGGWFVTRAYNYLKDAALDLLVWDATCGDYLGDYRMGEHNSIPMIRLMLPSLRNFGVITEQTEVVLTHLAPSLHKPHDETVKLVEKDGLVVAFDGMIVRL